MDTHIIIEQFVSNVQTQDYIFFMALILLLISCVCPTLAAVLHAYLLIQNLVWRALIQPRQRAKGFDRFERFHGLFLRIPEKEKRFYQPRLIQAQRNSGVRWLELRTAPHKAWYEAIRLKQAISDMQKDSLDMQKDSLFDRLRALFENNHSSNDKTQQDAGLIFHFIKQSEPLLKDVCIVPCRHSALRQQVMKQARQIRQVHRSRRFGPFILGLDAANSEINAGPEVFAAVIAWLRSMPSQPADPAYESLIRRFEPSELEAKR